MKSKRKLKTWHTPAWERLYVDVVLIVVVVAAAAAWQPHPQRPRQSKTSSSTLIHALSAHSHTHTCIHIRTATVADNRAGYSRHSLIKREAERESAERERMRVQKRM